MPRLAAVPDAPLRAVGLIRVSKERDEMISPELQRVAIEDHCTRRGYVVTRWIEGVDESGSQRRSKWWARLDEGVGLVEAGEADVLVVWRFSRTARQRLKWAVAIDRVEVAGGLLESATEPLDTSTASGRLARGMLAEFAAYEAEAIGNTWREVHARRTSRGLPANGKPRFGYRMVDGIHQPDPETGPILAELYRRYIAGEAVWTLAAWLNREKIHTVPGYSSKGPGDWSANGLRRMLDAGFGAGNITVQGSRQRGAHAPVIDSATWAAYLTVRATRRGLGRSERSTFLLSSMVWCSCGSKMGGVRYGQTSRAGFRCLANNYPSGPRHPGQVVRMDRVEAGVRAWLAGEADRLADLSVDQALTQRAHTTRRRADQKALAREIVEIDKAIGRLTADRAKNLIPDVAYRPAFEQLAQERAELEARRTAAEADASAAPPEELIAELHANWDVYALVRRRDALRRLIERVTVTWHPGGQVTVDVTPRWKGATGT